MKRAAVVLFAVVLSLLVLDAPAQAATCDKGDVYGGTYSVPILGGKMILCVRPNGFTYLRPA